ncbi:MAG: hypothetical protein ABL907_10505 [Hyphomicrobium sp.]
MAEPTDIIVETDVCAPGVQAELAHDKLDGSDYDWLLVRDNLPGRPAITTNELDVIERFFGDILDLVLSDNDSGSSASLRHNGLP